MRIAEYAACDATELAHLVRRREVAAEQVYAAAVGAIGEVNASLNAVANGPWEEPIEYANGGRFGGVPVVLKDLGCHPQGIPIRSGTRLSGHGVVFPHESFLVSRLRETGVALAAMTTTPELGLNANSEALVYGSTVNPWDRTKSAGGSSGGTAALVAAGAVPVGHANDGGGSLRIPAAFNGLVGLKPSRGRTSDGPDAQEVLSGLAAEFVITRTIRDSAAMLDALAGTMPGDKYFIKGPARSWSEEVGTDAGRLRVAVHTSSWSGSRVNPEVAAAVDAAGRELSDLGHYVEAATPTVDWELLIGAMLPIMTAACAERVDFLSAVTGNQPSPDTLESTTLACYEHGRKLTVREMSKGMTAANELARAVGAFFTEWDLLVTPTVTSSALPLGYLDSNSPVLAAEEWIRRIFGVCSFTPLFNISGTPAMSLPLGWTGAGMPIGVQLAAPMCEEAALIRVGSQLEEAMPWRGRRPPVFAGATGTATT